MVERWLPVVGWEGLYEVSDQGRVRSLDHVTVDTRGRRKGYKGKLRKFTLRSDGYLQVRLSKGPDINIHYGHDLVAAAFHGPKPPDFEVRHRNGRRADNAAGNLHYGTVKENQGDRIAHGTDIRGEQVYGAKLSPPEVIAIRSSGRSSRAEAEIYGVCHGTIKSVRRRKTWAHV